MRKVLGMGNALVDILTRLEDESVLNKFSLPKGNEARLRGGRRQILSTDWQILE